VLILKDSWRWDKTLIFENKGFELKFQELSITAVVTSSEMLREADPFLNGAY